MKSRIIWGTVLLAAFAAFYVVTIRPAMTPVPKRHYGPAAARTPLVTQPTSFPLPKEFMTATLPVPVFPTAPIPMIRVDPPKLELPIHNGATMDFSFGTPNVKSGGEDQAALDRALKEMAEATKDTKFEPKQ